MAPHILALDQGTTGSTALLFDAAGKVKGRGYREFAQHFPQPGWVEHDAEEIWKVTLEAANEAIRKARITAKEILALGITNQRETVVLWDRKTGKPIFNAIVWQCRRTTELCEQLKKRGLEETVREKTGLILDPYFSGTKVAWLLDHVNGARTRAERGDLAFGTIDAWLIWKLTGGKLHATDYTNASRTLLFDIHERAWSSDLCDALSVPMKILPEVRSSSGDFGITDKTIFGAPIPIQGVAGDQQAALFGHGAVELHQGKCTFGTGAFAVVYAGEQNVASQHGLLTTLACDAKGNPAYALEGSIFIAGAVVQWLRDSLQIITEAAETESVAQSVPDTGGVYFVPAFVGLGAPYWDAQARGALFGITRGTARPHIVRAALEAIAYQTAELIEAMNKDMGQPLSALHVDGGAVKNNFLSQFLADVLNLPVVRPSMVEMTGFGAARLAALQNELWPADASSGELPTRFEPKLSGAERKVKLAGWRDAVGRIRSAKVLQ